VEQEKLPDWLINSLHTEDSVSTGDISNPPKLEEEHINTPESEPLEKKEEKVTKKKKVAPSVLPKSEASTPATNDSDNIPSWLK